MQDAGALSRMQETCQGRECHFQTSNTGTTGCGWRGWKERWLHCKLELGLVQSPIGTLLPNPLILPPADAEAIRSDVVLVHALIINHDQTSHNFDADGKTTFLSIPVLATPR